MDFHKTVRAYEIFRVSDSKFRFVLVTTREYQQNARPYSWKSTFSKLQEYFHDMPTDPNTKQAPTLPFDIWKEWSRTYWMTIADVVSLPPNSYHHILTLDRNVMDLAPDDDETYKATDFFLKSKEVLFRGNDQDPISSSKIVFFSGTPEESKQPWHIGYGYGNILTKSPYWYPLNKGVLPGKDKQTGRKLTPNGKAKSWKQYPEGTYLGWRGPMVIWKRLHQLPRLYTTE
jgi:hypothetical protein